MTEHTQFLEKVMSDGNLKTIDDAKRATEVVFRTMRDVMTNDAADRVADDLEHDDAPSNEAVDLWSDTNPLVHLLSRIRPPLRIRSENFLVRLKQEANLTEIDPEVVIKAIFAATKEELPEERVQEISVFLPTEIQEIWQQA